MKVQFMHSQEVNSIYTGVGVAVCFTYSLVRGLVIDGIAKNSNETRFDDSFLILLVGPTKSHTKLTKFVSPR